MNIAALRFYLVALGTGLSSALFIPTLSLFLANDLQVLSWQVGTFYSVNALSSIAISFLVAHFSDRISRRKPLLIFCISMLMLNSLLFIFCRHYMLLITLGSLLSACGSAAVPQLFALARQTHSEAQFSAILRAQFSLAWVFGPPLAYWLIQQSGFTFLYTVITSIMFIVLLLSTKLPSSPASPSSTARLPANNQPLGYNLCYLMTTTLLVWTCSALYLIAFPLHLEREPSLSGDWTGILYGVAAALEIPVMLFSAKLLGRFSKKNQMQLAILCGLIFYAGVFFSRSFISLLLLQAFNAIFIAIIATVGLFWFQDLLKNRQGMAATLYTNAVSIGILIAGILQSLFTHATSLIIWPVACMLLVLSFLLLKKIEDI